MRCGFLAGKHVFFFLWLWSSACQTQQVNNLGAYLIPMFLLGLRRYYLSVVHPVTLFIYVQRYPNPLFFFFFLSYFILLLLLLFSHYIYNIIYYFLFFFLRIRLSDFSRLQQWNHVWVLKGVTSDYERSGHGLLGEISFVKQIVTAFDNNW